MTDLIVRIIELITGSLLIAVTLIFSAHYENQTLLLLPLIALPIIFSGMFDWHPAKVLALKLAGISRYFNLTSFIKPHIHSP
ncbi:hypothetical protein [Kaarinaea lacus]